MDETLQPGTAQEPADAPQPEEVEVADTGQRQEAATDDVTQDVFISQEDIDTPMTGTNLEYRAGSEDHDRGFESTAGQAVASAEALARTDEGNGLDRTANVWDQQTLPPDPGSYAHQAAAVADDQAEAGDVSTEAAAGDTEPVAADQEPISPAEAAVDSGGDPDLPANGGEPANEPPQA